MTSVERKMDPVPVGTVLKAVSQAAQRELEAVAAECGVAVPRLAAIERWSLLEPVVEAPQEDEVKAIAAALGSSLDQIVAQARGDGYPAVLLGRARGRNVELVFLRPQRGETRPGV